MKNFYEDNKQYQAIMDLIDGLDLSVQSKWRLKDAVIELVCEARIDKVMEKAEYFKQLDETEDLTIKGD